MQRAYVHLRGVEGGDEMRWPRAWAWTYFAVSVEFAVKCFSLVAERES